MADSKDWLEVERFLEQKERELLAKEGIVLPEDHLNGYKYAPKVKIARKNPWDVLPVPNAVPKCRSANWLHKDVNFEIGRGIAYLTLCRPDANNALNDTISQALHDACAELHNRSDVRVVVLRAEGKMFCAGSDPKSFADAHAMSDADNRKAASSFLKFLYYFQSLPQFTIGLVQGSAMGTGIGLLACCDLVCAVRAARFTASEVKLGACPATIAPFVTQKVGVTNAVRMLCTAENLTADKCLEMGLLNHVVDDEAEFNSIVAETCEKVTLCAPLAMSRSKKLAQNVAKQPVTFGVIAYTGEELAAIRVAPEAQAGFAAVVAKTKPYWADAKIKPLY